MGGSSGGRIPPSDLERLEKTAKESLKKASEDIRRHVFISFAHEDLDEVNLLRGQAKNEKTDLQFDDFSVKEPFDSENADYIKGKIREKLERCSVTLVYLTDESAASPWVNWEIEESLKRDKGVIGIYQGGQPPAKLPPLLRQNKCEIVKWEHAALTNAIERANRKR